MSAIQIIWSEQPKEGLEKQGKFQVNKATYYVECLPNGNVTISNRMSLDKVSFPMDPRHLLVYSGGKALKIDSPKYDDSGRFTFYLAHQTDVVPVDVQNILRCDQASAESIVSHIISVA